MFKIAIDNIPEFLRVFFADFISTSLQIHIFFYVLIFLLFLLWLISTVRKHRLRRTFSKTLSGIYALLVKKMDIQEDEKKLLETIAEFQENREEKHLILLDPHEFTVCVRKSKKIRNISDNVLDNLRKKIQHKMEKQDDFYTISAEIPIGRQVVLVFPNKTRMSGHVSTQETRHFTVSLDQDGTFPSAGDQLRIYIFNRTGVFSFPSTITKTLDGEVCLQHSDEIRSFQRRKYYRKETPVAVLIKTAHSEKPYMSSELVDVGGGGAALINPEKLFKNDDFIHITFTYTEERFSVIAKVVRTSQEGTVLHVRFETINDTTRERLISTLF